jgi:MOSC domain-containing protein YiiM
MHPSVVAVSRSARHRFSKENELWIRLIEGIGVEGDAHAGPTVMHRYDRRRHPDAPNLRQVHLIAGEALDELRAAGFAVGPGDLGENVTTRGVDLPGLPAGTRLCLGAEAVVRVTGLRTPCVQLDRFRPGLMAATLGRDERGRVVRKAGIMGIVLAGGDVRPGDPVRVELPPEPHHPLGPV